MQDEIKQNTEKKLIHPKEGKKEELKKGWADRQRENKNKYPVVVINPLEQ